MHWHYRPLFAAGIQRTGGGAGEMRCLTDETSRGSKRIMIQNRVPLPMPEVRHIWKRRPLGFPAVSE